MIALLQEYLRAIAADIFLILAAAGTGSLARKLLPATLLPEEGVALELLTGFGALGLLLFLAGTVKFSALVVFLLLVLPAAFGLRSVAQIRKAVASTLPSSKSLLILISAILIIVAISCLDKPIGTSDDVSYHLYGPRVWLSDAHIYPRLDNLGTALPATVETLFAAVMALSNPRAPGLITLAFFFVLLLLVRGLAVRLGVDSKWVPMAVALTVALPAIMDRVGVAFIDVPFAAFELASLRVLLDCVSYREAVAAGLFAGYGIGTKYTGLPFMLALGLTFLLLGEPVSWVSVRLKRAVLFSVAAGIAGGAWYARNWLILGSPIYPPPPSLAVLLPVKGMSLEAIRSFYQYNWEWGGAKFGRGFLAFALLPFRLTFAAPVFGGWAGALGPAPLAFFPFALSNVFKDRFGRACILWVFLVTAVWFFSVQELRYLMPAICMAPVLATVGFGAVLQRQSKLVRALAWSVIAVSLIQGAFTVVQSHSVRFRDVINPAYALSRQSQVIPHFSAFQFLNQSADVRKVIVLDPGVKSYYLEQKHLKLFGEYGERPEKDITDVPGALSQLQRLGASHVLDIFDPATGHFSVANPPPNLQLVFQDSDARVYRVLP